MEITAEQYEKIKDSFPLQRGNVRLTFASVERDSLCGRARLQMARSSRRFGNWHTIYVRMNRWAKSGALDKVFEKLQLEQIVRIKIEALGLDSTSVKVHPDAPGR